jgi:hypothetical protein
MDRAQTLKEKEEVTLSFMLTLAFWILAATVAFGSALAFLHLRAAKLPPWPVGALHGMAGATGLVVLILALQAPARGAEYGVSAFGPAAAVLVALALVMGLVVLILARRFRRTSGLVIAVHSTIAVTAFVLLLAYVSFS